MGVMEQVRYRLTKGDTNYPEMVKLLIEDHKNTALKLNIFYESYKQSEAATPILKRTFTDENKVNNKLANDFIGEIVDMKVGYMFGNPISYQIDKEAQGAEAANEEIAMFNKRNAIDDLDAETGKLATICGIGARLLYIDTEGDESVMNLWPWEVIFVYENNIEEPLAAIRYYKVWRLSDNDEWVEYIRAEWYTNEAIHYLLSDDKGEYSYDPEEPVNPLPHVFDEIPVIAFINNEEMQSDFEKVLSLIDGYDRTLSDVNSEIEQFRLAYMKLIGASIDDDTLDAALRTGVFQIPQEGCDLEFLTKELNDVIVENHLNRLEDNILRFAKSTNFKDESFAGQQSGVAIRYKLTPLESKCVTMERKFTTALRRQFKVLVTAWQKRNVTFDPIDTKFTFTRNIPINLLDEAKTTTKLKGMVSEETRLGQLTFVENVEEEIERMKADTEEMLDLGLVPTFNADKEDEDTEGEGEK
ncbi:MAG: phage portal protein [Actinobacteria bacterium]|nr:phage portal protein [Actinomycetota bacterium]